MAAADPGTDAARQAALRARDEFGEELVRLEAAGRAAVDVKAKIRRSPAKAAAIVGGASFLALGGPRRVVRGIRRIVRGPAPAYPKSMLPDEIERVVRSLGDDGNNVRGVLERGFADFVTANKKADRRFWRNAAMTLGAPIGKRLVQAAATRFTQPDDEQFADLIARIRHRGAAQPATEDRPDEGVDGSTG